MITTEKSIPKTSKQKRFSESRSPALYLKLQLPSQNSHNRSSSTTKNRNTRLLTDYQEYEASYHQAFLPRRLKKTIYQGKIRDSKGPLISQKTFNQAIVHSTKNNPQKNMDLKSLFKNKKSSQIKPKTPASSNHPMLKYIWNNKNKLTPMNKKDITSPYAGHITRIEKIYLKNAVEIKKRKGSTHKREGSFSLSKDQIKISTTNNQNGPPLPKSKFEVLKTQNQEQPTVKTIKKKNNQSENKQKQDSYYSENDSSQSFGLTEQEENVFGDRFPYGFQKVKLLGRGGFSLVWLGKHIKSGKQFAIKQIITQNTHQTHIKEIWFGTMFFTLGGVPKPQFASFSGIKNLVRMYSYEINQTDTWIFYQRCGCSLGSTLYDIRSEKVYGQDRLYKIYYKPIYQAMSSNPSILQNIIISICKTLALLTQTKIVHSDLKTQNILIKYDENSFQITEVKLIDYGSSFQFNSIAQFSMATPQYMPPQILNYIIHQNQGQYEHDLYEEVMNNYKNPWVVDIWSLGCVVLEMLIGVPLWMSLPLLVPIAQKNNKQGSFLQKQGLFAVKGRVFSQIINKQRNVVANLDWIMDNQNYSSIVLSSKMKKVLKGMLQINFNKRISPNEVIQILQKQSN